MQRNMSVILQIVGHARRLSLMNSSIRSEGILKSCDQERVEYESEQASRDVVNEASVKPMWRCTLCSKENSGDGNQCDVCGRKRGYVPETKSSLLPFHPRFRTLHAAGRSLVYSDVEAYLQAGCDPNVQDSQGWTGLHWAVALSRLDLIELYLDHDADINATRHDGFTPLHLACYIGEEKLTKMLVQRGADIEAKTDREGYTPLLIAAEQGNVACLQTLAFSGADLNAKTTHGEFTALHFIALNGNFEAANVLLSVSDDPVRLLALEHRGLEPTRLELSSKDVDGWSPYMVASFRGHKHIADIFLSHGAEEKDKKTLDSDIGYRFRNQTPKRFNFLCKE